MALSTNISWDMNQVPTSTRWTRDAVGDAGRQAVEAVYLLVGRATQSQGTGFILDNGHIVTNHHVVNGNSLSDLVGISPYENEIKFKNSYSDPNRDLAVLEPEDDLPGGLRLELADSMKPGTQVTTWGYPIGYGGPAPLLSVGFLAGFQEELTTNGPVKQLVVNGAFNNGNSGGPLFISGERRVIGVVVAKHVPLTDQQKVILEFLENQSGGMGWDMTMEDGSTQRWSLAQLIGSYLSEYHQLTQLMIGHAVDAVELAEFLEVNDLPVPKE